MHILSGQASSVDVKAPGIDVGAVAVGVHLHSRFKRVVLHQLDVVLVEQGILGLENMKTTIRWGEKIASFCAEFLLVCFSCVHKCM